LWCDALFAGRAGCELEKYGWKSQGPEYKGIKRLISDVMTARVNAAGDGMVIAFTLLIAACTLISVARPERTGGAQLR
jgi:hypothetical protein